MFDRISVSQAEFDEWLADHYEHAYSGKYYMKYERDELPKNYWIYLSEKVTGEPAKGIHHLGCLCCYADTIVKGPTCEALGTRADGSWGPIEGEHKDCKDCFHMADFQDSTIEAMYKMVREFYENKGPVRVDKVKGVVTPDSKTAPEEKTPEHKPVRRVKRKLKPILDRRMEHVLEDL